MTTAPPTGDGGDSGQARAVQAPLRLKPWLLSSLIMVAVNAVVGWVTLERLGRGDGGGLVAVICAALAVQLFLAIGALTISVRLWFRTKQGRYGGGALGSLLLVFAGLAEFAFGWLLLMFGGSGWGRPLRIRGRLRHPELVMGSDWSRGGTPDVSALDWSTRRALEALWLHDAKKEHASVPAFARISWLLAAVGAPPELLEGAHRAGLEEIDHARRCFALAAAYGGRSHTVSPMPDLLQGGLELSGSPLQVLAVESLGDGCLLEDFNADVARECAATCEEPVTRDVLERIAKEERSHADFSWNVLSWAVERGGAPVIAAASDALGRLAETRRPTATSWRTLPLVARADKAALRHHGRIADERWGELWAVRLSTTKRRAAALLERRMPVVSGAAPSETPNNDGTLAGASRTLL